MLWILLTHSNYIGINDWMGDNAMVLKSECAIFLVLLVLDICTVFGYIGLFVKMQKSRIILEKKFSDNDFFRCKFLRFFNFLLRKLKLKSKIWKNHDLCVLTFLLDLIFLTLNVGFRRNRAVVKCWHRNSGSLFGTRDRVFSRGDSKLGRARFPTQQIAVRDWLCHRGWSCWRFTSCNPLCCKIFENFFRKLSPFSSEVCFNSGFVSQKNLFHSLQNLVVVPSV